MTTKTRDEPGRGLVRNAREDDAAMDAYVVDDFVFHSPERNADLSRLKDVRAAGRSAFDDLTATCGHVVSEGGFAAAHATTAEVERRETAAAPAGPPAPTGAASAPHLISMSGHDAVGGPAKERVRFDARDMLCRPGAGRP